MKHSDLVVTVVEKVKEQANQHAVAFRVGGVSGICAGIMANPTMVSFATETSGGTNIINAETMAVITNAFSSLGITATAIIVMAMSATVGVMLLAQACDYALKRMKAAFKKAA